MKVSKYSRLDKLFTLVLHAHSLHELIKIGNAEITISAMIFSVVSFDNLSLVYYFPYFPLT